MRLSSVDQQLLSVSLLSNVEDPEAVCSLSNVIFISDKQLGGVHPSGLIFSMFAGKTLHVDNIKFPLVLKLNGKLGLIASELKGILTIRDMQIDI